jgi:DNA-binding GntR family transcriptional regulator
MAANTRIATRTRKRTPVSSEERPDRVHPPASGSGLEGNSLVQDAYRALKASILDGTLPPGYQAVENRIAEQLKMSRTPVHEAVIRLQNEGFLRVLPRRGVQILRLSAEDMRDTYDVIIALEGMAAALIASMPDPHSASHVIDRMMSATDAMERALYADDLRAWALADDVFHRALVNDCGNPRLARLAATMTDQAQRARTITMRLRPAPTASVAEHRAILAALARRDKRGARNAVEQHRYRASREIIAALELL